MRIIKSLSENPSDTPSGEGELKMQKGQVVRGFLFPADQQASCAIGPRVRAFHDPSASACGSAMRALRVLAFAGNVNDVAAASGGTANGFGVVALVGTQMLTLARPWCRTADGEAFECFRDQLLVMHIGPGNRDTHGHTATVGQHGAFDAQLATIGRVFPGFFPRPVAPWSSPRPNFATASRSPAGRHTPATPVATVCETRRAAPTPESRRAGRCPNRTRWASPSTGSPSAAHTKPRSPRFAAEAADDHLYNCVCNSGVPAPSVPRAHRESGQTLTNNLRPLAHLHATSRQPASRKACGAPNSRTVLG